MALLWLDHRYLCAADRWLACFNIDEDPGRSRRAGSGNLAKKIPDNKSLVHHSDRGSQYLSIKYTEPLAEAEIDLSVGIVGDAYNNALAECVNGLFKTEVINQIGPWKSMREANGKPSNGSIGIAIAFSLAPSDTTRPQKKRRHSMQT